MKKEFKAESKKLLDLMIHSIYTNKEIFLRELISNSSDAIDKVYLKKLQDNDGGWNPDQFTIDITPNKEDRTLVIEDHGIGMNKEELDENLGTIAKSGTLDLKENVSVEDLKDVEIIGQFGVGFYSSFMVADKVVVETRKYGEEQGYRWESTGVDGYSIEEIDKDEHGTKITLHLKEKDDDEDYDMYLEDFYLTELIKKYSNYIRYPIRLPKEAEDEEDGVEYHMVNSRVPIWKKNRDELSEEDYKQFYREEFMGFDDPLRVIHFHAEGLLSYRALLYIPSKAPFNYYVQDYEKGLALYANGVMIMEKCEELLPDYFGFVKGVVDSEDLSLNISREMLQQNRQLSMMAKRIETKIKEELEKVLKEDREAYDDFFDEFGRQLKVGIYQTFGAAKDVLADLLIYHSSIKDKRITLKEYIEAMKDDQKYIYYAAGPSLNHIKRLPQTKRLVEQGFPVLYLDDEIDEFVIKAMYKYDDYDFKSVSSEDVDVLNEEEKQEVKQAKEDYDLLFKKAKEYLGDKVTDVVPSTQLEEDASCLTAKGELSIEMEKLLAMAPEGQQLKADKVLELNIHHELFKKLDEALIHDEKLFHQYVDLIYNQARLIEGLPIEDPVEFVRNMNDLM